MRVLIVSPTFFDPSSVVGGGERYPMELARALSSRVETTLVSFSKMRMTRNLGAFRLEVFPVTVLLGGNRLNPLSFSFLQLLGGADIIHTHQAFTMVSDLACLGAALLGKKAFVTDHGGGAARVLNRRLPLLQTYRAAICYSDFMIAGQARELRDKTLLIKGGINQSVFCPDPSVPRQNHLLYVGRLLPHKGVDYLVKAFRLWARPGWRLRLVGRVYDEPYFNDLKRLSEGLAVDFIQNASDEALLHEYRSARATILPSVFTDCRGVYYHAPEQMGFTLLESQSCATPAICTDAGAMPEFVNDGVTGRVARQNSPESLAEAFAQVCDPARWPSLSAAARPFCARFSWEEVARLHLRAYAER